MNTTAVQTLDDGRMPVAAEFLPLLRANGLDAFEKVMSAKSEHFARKFPGRNTVKMELKSSEGRGIRTVYLKRYEPDYLSGWNWFLRAIHWPGADDEAGREWRMLHLLRGLGFDVATPIATGQKKSCGVVTRSFVMTEEIPDATQADHYCQKLDAMERRRFATELGMLARRFHDTGLTHRDFYLGHFFVVEENKSRKLFLIDLQRVFRPRLFRERWLIKDIAALGFIALKSGATSTDLMRFIKIYLDTDRLRPSDKRFIRKLLRRIAWLQTRTPKHDPPRK